MMIRAQDFTLQDVARAFDDFVEVNGHEAALAALEETTGVRDLAAVPPGKILNAMATLVCGLLHRGSTARAKKASSARERFAVVQNSLAGMAKEIYAPKEPPDGQH